MTTNYMEEQGFKKKYLAPLIVLMLCAVSLTGTAYAYNTTVTGYGDISGDYYSIDLYGADGTTVISTNLQADGNKHFEVQTDKIIGGVKDSSGNVTKTGNYWACIEKDTVVTFSTKVKVTANDKATYQDCKIVTESAKYIQQDGTTDFYKSWAADATKPTCTVAFYEAGTETAVTAFKVNTVYDVKITVTLPAIASQDLKVSTPDEIAEKIKFNGVGCIEIKLKATEVTA